MNTEMMLVCKIIQTGKMRDVLEFGLAPEDFTSPEARTMYERILSVYQRAESSGSVLGPTLAKEVFPNLPWTEVDEHVTVDHLCHEVRSNRLRVLFRMALAEAIPKLDGAEQVADAGGDRRGRGKGQAFARLNVVLHDAESSKMSGAGERPTG
jgi:hypothetical protein